MKTLFVLACVTAISILASTDRVEAQKGSVGKSDQALKSATRLAPETKIQSSPPEMSPEKVFDYFGSSLIFS